MRLLWQPSRSTGIQRVGSSTGDEVERAPRAKADDADRMTDYMTHGYAISFGEARSCLAALADTAPSVDESIYYDQLLLRLDLMHEDYPGCPGHRHSGGVAGPTGSRRRQAHRGRGRCPPAGAPP